MKYKMGVVGLGVMGASLARNIESKGFPVVGYDLDKKKMQGFLEGPAKGKAIAGADKPVACRPPIRSSSACQVLSCTSCLTGRVSTWPVRTPPAQWQVTATRSLAPSTVATTRSKSSRAIACRSQAVVVGACHKAGMSSVSWWIVASSAAVSGSG